MNFGALSEQFGADKALFVCYHNTIGSVFREAMVRAI